MEHKPSTQEDNPLTRATSPRTQERVANRRLSAFELTHRWDPNISTEDLDNIKKATDRHDARTEVNLDNEFNFNSPYPEVRAVVRNYDEQLPSNTIRAWIIGMILTTVGSGLNMLFSLRAPSIAINSYVAQLVAYPMGIGLAKLLPNREFNTLGMKWNLNPGRFNIKEHTLIVVMATASFAGSAGYFTDVIVSQRMFYGQNFGWGFNILLALTTQLTGFGIAGILRKMLVEPPSMIWPSNLVSVAFLYTLHDHSETATGVAAGPSCGTGDIDLDDLTQPHPDQRTSSRCDEVFEETSHTELDGRGQPAKLAGSRQATELAGSGTTGYTQISRAELAISTSDPDIKGGVHDKSPRTRVQAVLSSSPDTTSWKITPYRWFLYLGTAAFIWYWIPGLIFQALSVFAFATWIRPNSVIVNQLFGGWTGVSLIPITFDWTQVTGYIFSPLISPWHAIANTLIGTVGFYIFLTVILHYSGVLFAEYLPISSSGVYDNMQNSYNVSEILTPEFTLDLAKYKAYSPLFLSTTFALTYGLSFAALTAVIVHTTLFHGREIWLRARASHDELDDIHTKMMKKYPTVPNWWYGSLFLLTIAMSFAMIYGWPTHLTWWALVIAIFIPVLWTLPIGIIVAITNIALGLNVLTEFLIGYMLPGRPVAMMIFKCLGYITMAQALTFLADLKLGHYMKIPQRTMFWGQIIATVWSCLVQLAVMEYALKNVKGICTAEQPDKFTCPGQAVFFRASVIWGLIGPQRIFSPGALYSNLQWFWLAGAALPVVIYAGARMFPRSNIRFLSAPVIFGGTGQIPPATPLNYLSWGIVGWVFQKYIRNRHRGWWMRYNYVTSAALDVGLALSTIVIIAALNLTNTNFPNWWGNVGALNTMDVMGTAVQKTVSDGEKFGPKVGSW